MPVLPPIPPPTLPSGTGPYSYVTLAQMRQELANRLYDSAQVFWSSVELNAYITEALRTWNALTSYWRGDFQFPTLPVTQWNDLTNLPNTLRPYTVTDTTIYNLMQWHFLEPAPQSPSFPLNPWTGSAQFTADDFLNAVMRRRDEILSTTGCTVTRRTVPAVLGRITLPDTVIDMRRMAYFPATGSPSIVWPEDTWGEMAFNIGYAQQPAGTPATYLQSTQPPISFDVDRPPGFAGSYELLTIEAGGALAVNIASLLMIPDDWTHLIKWGAMADLLGRESNAKDAMRQQYCEGRYRMGLALLADAPALLVLRINGVPTQIDSVRGADSYQTTWQTLVPGKPSHIYYTGLNMFAFSPAPDNGPYSCVATVVKNAPVPTADNASVQMGRDDYDVVLDYAQHLAAFKQGGTEFLATMAHFQRFMKQAAIYSSKLNELGEYTSALYGLAAIERNMNPVTTPTGESDAS